MYRSMSTLLVAWIVVATAQRDVFATQSQSTRTVGVVLNVTLSPADKTAAVASLSAYLTARNIPASRFSFTLHPAPHNELWISLSPKPPTAPPSEPSLTAAVPIALDALRTNLPIRTAVGGGSAAASTTTDAGGSGGGGGGGGGGSAVAVPPTTITPMLVVVPVGVAGVGGVGGGGVIGTVGVGGATRQGGDGGGDGNGGGGSSGSSSSSGSDSAVVGLVIAIVGGSVACAALVAVVLLVIICVCRRHPPPIHASTTTVPPPPLHPYPHPQRNRGVVGGVNSVVPAAIAYARAHAAAQSGGAASHTGGGGGGAGSRSTTPAPAPAAGGGGGGGGGTLSGSGMGQVVVPTVTSAGGGGNGAVVMYTGGGGGGGGSGRATPSGQMQMVHVGSGPVWATAPASNHHAHTPTPGPVIAYGAAAGYTHNASTSQFTPHNGVRAPSPAPSVRGGAAHVVETPGGRPQTVVVLMQQPTTLPPNRSVTNDGVYVMQDVYVQPGGAGTVGGSGSGHGQGTTSAGGAAGNRPWPTSSGLDQLTEVRMGAGSIHTNPHGRALTPVQTGRQDLVYGTVAPTD